MISDVQIHLEYAEETVVLLYPVPPCCEEHPSGPLTGCAACDRRRFAARDDKPDAIGLIGDSGVLDFLWNRDAALAVAARIIGLAVELPNPPPTPDLDAILGHAIRRRSDVDARLRALDD